MSNKKDDLLGSRIKEVSRIRANIWFTIVATLVTVATFIVVRDRFFASFTISSNLTQAANTSTNNILLSKITSNIKRCSDLSSRIWVGSSARTRASSCATKLAQIRQELLKAMVGKNPQVLLQKGISLTGTNNLPDAAKAYTENSINRSQGVNGVVSAVYNDSGSGGGISGYTLSDSKGDSYNLYVSGGLPSGIDSGDKVAVTSGAIFGSTMAVPSSGISQLVTSSHVPVPRLGTKKVAIVRFKVNGATPFPTNFAEVETGLEEYYRRVSFTRMPVEVTVLGEPNIQSDLSSYCSGGVAGVPDFILDWTNKVEVPAGYDYYTYVIPAPCAGGLGPLNSNKNYVFAGSVLSTFVHELGHNLGAGHAAGADGTFDPMTNNISSPVPHFNNIHKTNFSWIDGDSVTRVTSDALVDLVSSELPSGKRTIIIPGYCNGKDYYLERRPSTANLLIRCNSEPGESNNYVDSALVGQVNLGEQFSQNNVKITPQTDGKIEIKINGAPPSGPPGPGGGSNRTREGTVTGSLGSFTLQCPSEILKVQSPGSFDAQLLAHGNYAGGTVNVTVPVRGDYVTPHYGIREENFGTGSTLHMNESGNLRIHVINEVAPGSYRVPVMASGISYEPNPNAPGQQRQYRINSVCYFNLVVTSSPTISETPTPPPIGGHATIDITANGSHGALSVPAGSLVTLRWSSTNARTCEIIPQTWREPVLPNGSVTIPAASNFYNLACIGNDNQIVSAGVRVSINTSGASLVCSPLRTGVLGGDSFIINMDTKGTVQEAMDLSLDYSNQLHFGGNPPLISIDSSSTRLPASGGNIKLNVRPITARFPSGGLIILAKDSSGSLVGSCEVVVDVGSVYPTPTSTPGATPTPSTSATPTPGPEGSPSVSIISPSSGSAVSSPFSISARAMFGSSPMQSIKIYVDGMLRETCKSSNPCEINYDPSSHERGDSIPIYAIARDEAFKEVTSQTINVIYGQCTLLERILGQCGR